VPIPGLERWRSEGRCLTPDDIMDGKKPAGTVLVFDDDHSYPGGVLAEAMLAAGIPTILVTPAPLVSAWTVNTLEQERIQRRLIEMDVEILANRILVAAHEREVEFACSYTGRRSRIACDAVIVVTERLPNESLATALRADSGRLESAGIRTLQVIGDAFAPGLIAAAVYSGHAAARGFEEDAAVLEAQLFRREMPDLEEVG
jgi:dimethylamine/trimethylamine dehydrogenase